MLPIAALATMLVGFALGSTSLRLKGDYLAIVTLAFAQIFKLLLLNLDTPINITGGANGIYSFDPINIFGFKIISPVAYGYLIWFFAFLAAVGSFRIKRSRLGRGWEAIREDELAAEAMGVNTTWMKLMAFAVGAFVAGASGAVFARMLVREASYGWALADNRVRNHRAVQLGLSIRLGENGVLGNARSRPHLAQQHRASFHAGVSRQFGQLRRMGHDGHGTFVLALDQHR